MNTHLENCFSYPANSFHPSVHFPSHNPIFSKKPPLWSLDLVSIFPGSTRRRLPVNRDLGDFPKAGWWSLIMPGPQATSCGKRYFAAPYSLLRRADQVPERISNFFRHGPTLEESTPVSVGALLCIRLFPGPRLGYTSDSPAVGCVLTVAVTCAPSRPGPHKLPHDPPQPDTLSSHLLAEWRGHQRPGAGRAMMRKEPGILKNHENWCPFCVWADWKFAVFIPPNVGLTYFGISYYLN